MDKRIRYAAAYNGPSYGPSDSFEGFYTLADAREMMKARVYNSGRYPMDVIELSEDSDGRVTGSMASLYFPATSHEDYMDLYPVDSDGRRASEPTLRLSVTARGRTITDKF